MKIVGVDFDETISDCEHGWLRVLETLEKVGYQVIVVTYRAPTDWPEDLDFLRTKGYKVYMTGRQGKRRFLEKLGVKVDIWIDDTPESILYDYNTSTWKFEQ